MSTLLGLNFGSHRQAYFQVRVIVHELTNVPMVAGEFKAKWRIDHTHNLSSALLASAAGPSSASDDQATRGHSALASDAKDKLLAHKKSSSTLASQSAVAQEAGGGGGGGGGGASSVDSASLHARDRDDASSTYSAGASSNSLPRKMTPKFLTGLREALTGKETTEHNVEENAESVAEKWKKRESSSSSEPPSTTEHRGGSLPYEPRGETGAASVQENKVVWDRQINAGVRIAIDKPRTGSSGTDHLTPRRSASYKSGGAALSGGGGLGGEGSGASTPLKEQPSTPTSTSFGHLGLSELKVTIKAEVPTGTESASSKSVVRMGSLTVNLSEFAPYPPHHHHHHHHHHHNHHHHHHHHHHEHPKNGSQHNHQPLTRLETRKYLLQDGPTNATIKLTVEMTHVGGSKEYTVPSNKRGLLVFSEGAGLPSNSSTQKDNESSAANRSPTSPSSSGSHGSAAGSQDGAATTTSNTAANVSSSTTATAKAFTEWHPHSVARHARIPDANLSTTVSHKDTARAVKEAGGGGRLAFSFAAGAHHDRPPEDVIDAIFSGQSAQSLLASPTPAGPSSSTPRKPASRPIEAPPKARDMVKG